MVNYKKTKIIKISNCVDNTLFIRATTLKYISHYKRNTNKYIKKQGNTNKLYNKIRVIGMKKFKFILVEEYACDNIDEVNARIEYWKEKLNPTHKKEKKENKPRINYRESILELIKTKNINTLDTNLDNITHRYSKIKFICNNNNCKEIVTKNVQSIVIKKRFYCNICTTNLAIEKMKKTCLEKYGKENYSQTKECKKKVKKTCLEKYGKENYFQTEECKDKVKKTCLEKYGKESYTQTEEYNDKVKKTCLEKYGKEHHTQTEECKDKKIKTCLEKYGKEYYFQTKDFKENKKNKMLEKYGAENPMYVPEFFNKMKKTCLEKYGAKNPMHVPEIFHKMIKSSFSKKEYTFKNNITEFVQGYEHFALEILENNGYTYNDILLGKDIPVFNYNNTVDNRNSIYYPDIYIKKENKIIEVIKVIGLLKKILIKIF